MCVCVCVHKCIYMCDCIHVCGCLCTLVNLHACLFEFMFVSLSVLVSVLTCICVNALVYVQCLCVGLYL